MNFLLMARTNSGTAQLVLCSLFSWDYNVNEQFRFSEAALFLFLAEQNYTVYA